MRIALFRHLSADFESVGTDKLEPCDAYLRVSEYVDVEFPPIKTDYLEKQVAALDRARESIVAEFNGRLSDIDQRKAELLGNK